MAVEPRQMSAQALSIWRSDAAELTDDEKILMAHIAWFEQAYLAVTESRDIFQEDSGKLAGIVRELDIKLEAQQPVVDAAVAWYQREDQASLAWLYTAIHNHLEGGDADGLPSRESAGHTTAPAGQAGVKDRCPKCNSAEWRSVLREQCALCGYWHERGSQPAVEAGVDRIENCRDEGWQGGPPRVLPAVEADVSEPERMTATGRIEWMNSYVRQLKAAVAAAERWDKERIKEPGTYRPWETALHLAVLDCYRSDACPDIEANETNAELGDKANLGDGVNTGSSANDVTAQGCSAGCGRTAMPSGFLCSECFAVGQSGGDLPSTPQGDSATREVTDER